MDYLEFEFKNFRGIASAKLSMPTQSTGGPPVVTLVGLNESGKTTVLEAIDSFDPSQPSEDEVSPRAVVGWERQQPEDLIPIARRSNFNDTIDISGTVALDADDQEAVRKAVRAATGFRIKNLNGTIRITYRLQFKDSKFVGSSTLWPRILGDGYLRTGQVLRGIKSIGTASELQAWRATLAAIKERLPKVWYFPNFLFEFPDEIVLTPEVNEGDTQRFYRSLFNDLLANLDAKLNVDKHVIARVRTNQAGDRRNVRQLALELGRDVTRTVLTSWDEIFQNADLSSKGIRISVEDVDGRVAADGLPTVVARFTLEDQDGEYAISERSLGFRWFFVYMLLTSFRQSDRGAGGTIFLLDEPASNLHPSAQAALLSSLERLAQSSTVVYTTHTHHLVNPAWLANTHVVVNHAVDPRSVDSRLVARQTDVTVSGVKSFISQNPNRRFYFQPVLDALHYAPSQLELVPEVVMVEGKADYFAFRYVHEVVGIGANRSLAFLPGTGASTLDAVIQLYSAWSRSFVVLLDNDAEGVRAEERYRSRFGVLVEDRILRLGVAGDDVTAAESLFTSQDQARLIEAASLSGSASKARLNNALEILLAERRSVELDNESSGRFSKLFAACAKVLD